MSQAGNTKNAPVHETVQCLKKAVDDLMAVITGLEARCESICVPRPETLAAETPMPSPPRSPLTSDIETQVSYIVLCRNRLQALLEHVEI